MSRGKLDDLMCDLAPQGAQPRKELDTVRVYVCPQCAEDWFHCPCKGHILKAPPPTERWRAPWQRFTVLA